MNYRTLRVEKKAGRKKYGSYNEHIDFTLLKAIKSNEKLFEVPIVSINDIDLPDAIKIISQI